MRVLAAITTVGAAAGLVYMPVIANTITVSLAIKFALQGMIITLLVFGFELFVARGRAGEWFRREPFAIVFATRTVVAAVLILIAYLVGGLALFPERLAGETVARDFARDTLFALGVGAVLQFMIMVRDLVGGRVLSNMIAGRYHRPLTEDRVFMFLDMSGSTKLTLELGGEAAYAMISRFFFDVAQETARFGGETHRYIGDEVVVTWPLDHGVENARCLRCYFAIVDRITGKADSYRRNFGRTPEFRVGLHGGPVVAGECGDDKKEIVYFGDTINTAARVGEACKEFGRPLLVSGELTTRFGPISEFSAQRVGEMVLRGRELPTELFAFERDAGTVRGEL